MYEYLKFEKKIRKFRDTYGHFFEIMGWTLKSPTGGPCPPGPPSYYAYVTMSVYRMPFS